MKCQASLHLHIACHLNASPANGELIYGRINDGVA